MPAIHRHAHDYRLLIRRWRKVARQAGLPMRRLCEAGGHTLYYLAPARPAPGPRMYFSAGIHGDEPAATEGLVTWAETNPRLLRATGPLIFPCLNPWGLINNSRFDQDGRDLNRCYNKRNVPVVAAQSQLMAGVRFDLALTLHEDFDAHGVYIYEISRRRPFLAEGLLLAASAHIPVDGRTRIEGRRARRGVIRRRITPDLMPDWPEAFALHFGFSARTLTVETPSEFDLDARVAAQAAMIDHAAGFSLAEVRAGAQSAISA